MLGGMVVEYHREYCSVQLDDGREVVAKPAGRLELDARQFARQLSVGDKVELVEAEAGSWVIERIEPRETWLLRTNLGSYRNKPQCIVANAEQLAVVIAPAPELSLHIADRYFLSAIMGGLSPLLIINKADLLKPGSADAEAECYRRQGYAVYFTNAKTGAGVDALRPALADKLTAFCGHSGVGKSTLLKSLTGRDDIIVGAVNMLTSKGRQTTTTSRIYHLDSGGLVVDTPGVKEFGLHELDWTEVQGYFADIGELALGCAFRNCLHAGEPGCAVLAAVESGALSSSRLESYITLRREARAQELAF